MRDWRLILLRALFALLFPLVILGFHIYAILQICRKKEVNDKTKLWLVTFVGAEASFECFPQILLQLFTILNGYTTNPLQMLTIVASFVALAMSAISQDIDMKVHETGETLRLKP